MTVITHTTRSAFMMAFHQTIAAAWPGTTAQEAETYFKELGMTFGSPGYIWSVTAAIDLAKDYMSQCCETA